MLVTPNFVFIHLPKTAGRFIRHQILEHAGPVLFRGGLHGPIERLPDQFQMLPIIAFVRNPWDWYVSWFFHMQDSSGFNPLFANAVKAGNNDFTSIMHYMFDSMDEDSEAAKNLDNYIQSPEHLQRESHDLDQSMINFQRENGCGMLTWRYKFNVGENENVTKHVGKFESLVEDLIQCLKSCNVPLSQPSEFKIRMARPVGEGETRAKRDFRSLYTDSRLIERVAEKEHFIVDRFGYNFE